MDKPVKKVVLDVSGHFPEEGKKKKVVTEKIWNKQNSRKVSFIKSTKMNLNKNAEQSNI